MLHPGFPVADGTIRLTETWSLTLDQPHSRRVEDGSLVLWRPGFTAWIDAWGAPEGQDLAARIAGRRAAASADASEIREERAGAAALLLYRLVENGQRVLHATAFAAAATLEMAFYHDDPDDLWRALAIARSVRPG